ncbi:MAG TPA: hypothetical protein VMF69_00895 [Gemmataceae bacterium]|nr:hypothetical protein [Gemmataceae bacterium]
MSLQLQGTASTGTLKLNTSGLPPGDKKIVELRRKATRSMKSPSRST